MNNKLYLFILLLLFPLSLSKASENFPPFYQEYGIVLIPESICLNMASAINNANFG